MARKTPAESNAAAQRRLTDAMLSLGHSIDKQRDGPQGAWRCCARRPASATSASCCGLPGRTEPMFDHAVFS